MNGASLDIQGVTVQFGGLSAFDDVSLTARRLASVRAKLLPALWARHPPG